MQFTNRYSVPTSEDYEPGSNGQVLKNFLGITDSEVMNALEEEELKRTELELIEIFDENHRFTSDDICNIHELWLGDIYPMAGRYRTVTMLKDNFLFATADIQMLMKKFQKNYLNKFTPCHFSSINELAYALGCVHVELILIHPFRDGNGRTARLLANLMAMQAKKPPLNFASIDQTLNKNRFESYILAIHAGVDGNYKPIERIFTTIIEQSIT